MVEFTKNLVLLSKKAKEKEVEIGETIAAPDTEEHQKVVETIDKEKSQ